MSVHALLLGLIAGLVAGGRDMPGLLLATAFALLVLPLSAAVSVWSHPRLAVQARRRTAGVIGVLALAGALMLLHGPASQLLMLGSVGSALAGAYTAARALKGPRSILAELAAIACICLLAPLAWLLVAGATGGWPLSASAAFLAFGGTVPYVRERVRRRRLGAMSIAQRLRGGASALLWQVTATTAAGAAMVAGVVHLLVTVAFLPGAAKTFIGIARPESRPPLKRVGYLETAIATLFAGLAGVGLGMAGRG